jgi:hypothetical protein
MTRFICGMLIYGPLKSPCGACGFYHIASIIVNANHAFGVTGASIICPFGGGHLSKMAHIPLL